VLHPPLAADVVNTGFVQAPPVPGTGAAVEVLVGCGAAAVGFGFGAVERVAACVGTATDAAAVGTPTLVVVSSALICCHQVT
jgi:hypothetical protein